MHIRENIKSIPGLACLLLILSGGYAMPDRGTLFMIEPVELVKDPVTGLLIPEIWKNVTDKHQVSNYGRILSFVRYPDGALLKPWLSTTGYYTVCLKWRGKKIRVHRIVAKAFVPNPDDKPHINHKNGIKTDCFSRNLEWCTQGENNAHALETGLRKMPGGSDHYNARKVINSTTSQVFNSIEEASSATGVNVNTLRCYLAGFRKNKTQLQYL